MDPEDWLFCRKPMRPEEVGAGRECFLSTFPRPKSNLADGEVKGSAWRVSKGKVNIT